MAYFDPLVQTLTEQISALKPGETLLLLLEGDLGVGKTQLTKELLAYYSYPLNQVQSPTFLKLIEHRVPTLGKVLHLDLYRMDSVLDVQKLDLESYENQRLMIVEWPRLMREFLALHPHLKASLGLTRSLQVRLEMSPDESRQWTVTEIEI